MTSRFNLPGRLAWCLAELVGPLNFLFILYTLPSRLDSNVHTNTHTNISYERDTSPIATAPDISSLSLPLAHQILATLYLLHYANRAVITPLFLAPSISPIHAFVTLSMVIFQSVNSSLLAAWLVYDAQYHHTNNVEYPPLISAWSLIGLALFAGGMVGNIWAEGRLFTLRRGEARARLQKRMRDTENNDEKSGDSEAKPRETNRTSDKKDRACDHIDLATSATTTRVAANANANTKPGARIKSKEKAQLSYDKIYILPPPTGLFKYILYPHYTLEWLEWVGYYLLAASWGLGLGLSFSLPLPSSNTAADYKISSSSMEANLGLRPDSARYSAALWFVVMEVSVMAPRAVGGVKWYRDLFGEGPVAGRKAVIPGLL